MTTDIMLQVNDVAITGRDILSAVDDVLVHVKKTGDTDFAANALVQLKGIEKITGKAVAKLVSGLQEWWDEEEMELSTGDSFDDWIYSIDVEFNATYIRRCIMIEKYESNGTFSERIMARPIKEKQAIASHLEQGYELTSKDWKELERSSNEYEVGEILRNAKGKPPRKNTLGISLERDGSLTVWYQDENFFGGYLAQPKEDMNEKEQEALEKMLHRLTKNTGVKIK